MTKSLPHMETGGGQQKEPVEFNEYDNPVVVVSDEALNTKL